MVLSKKVLVLTDFINHSPHLLVIRTNNREVVDKSFVISIELGKFIDHFLFLVVIELVSHFYLRTIKRKMRRHSKI